MTPRLTKLDHDAFLLSGAGGPYDPGPRWNVDALLEAHATVASVRTRLELANVLGPGVLRACNELLAELDKDIEGCEDENRGG